MIRLVLHPGMAERPLGIWMYSRVVNWGSGHVPRWQGEVRNGSPGPGTSRLHPAWDYSGVLWESVEQVSSLSHEPRGSL